MKLLISGYNNNILSYGNAIEKGIFPEADPVNVIYKIIHDDGTASYYMIGGANICEVDSIPDEVKNDIGKYCYTSEEGFYVDPKWREPEKPIEEKVSNLEEYSADLLYQVSLLQLGLDDSEA